jgi:uncharacterized membrane protein YgdD (TMEM256/DUF423 family)
MKPSIWLTLGAIAAALGVAIGAFGAHELPRYLSGMQEVMRDKRLDQFETGVRYHMYQALGLVALGLAAERRISPWFTVAGWLFGLGIVLFSGLLYLLVLLELPWLGIVVPTGGVAAIGAWVCLAVGSRSK